MPYIQPEAKAELSERAPATPGELNYILTVFCLDYVENNKECYQTFNDVLGALEGAKLEFYRRKVAPYEDLKAHENGDIYKDVP